MQETYIQTNNPVILEMQFYLLTVPLSRTVPPLYFPCLQEHDFVPCGYPPITARNPQSQLTGSGWQLPRFSQSLPSLEVLEFGPRESGEFPGADISESCPSLIINCTPFTQKHTGLDGKPLSHQTHEKPKGHQ